MIVQNWSNLRFIAWQRRVDAVVKVKLDVEKRTLGRLKRSALLRQISP